jgi:hypothetical protein
MRRQNLPKKKKKKEKEKKMLTVTRRTCEDLFLLLEFLQHFFRLRLGGYKRAFGTLHPLTNASRTRDYTHTHTHRQTDRQTEIKERERKETEKKEKRETHVSGADEASRVGTSLLLALPLRLYGHDNPAGFFLIPEPVEVLCATLSVATVLDDRQQMRIPLPKK